MGNGSINSAISQGVTVVNIPGTQPNPFAAPPKPQGPDKDVFESSAPPPYSKAANDPPPAYSPPGFFAKTKAFLKGIGKGFTGMLDNPLQTLGCAVGMVVLGTVAPWTIPLMVVAGIGVNGYRTVKNFNDSRKDFREGRNAEGLKKLEGSGTNFAGFSLSLLAARSFAKAPTAAEAGGKPPADFISLRNGWHIITGKWKQVGDNFTSTMSRTKEGMQNIGNGLLGRQNYYKTIGETDHLANLKDLVENPWKSTKNIFGSLFLGKEVNAKTGIVAGEVPVMAGQDEVAKQKLK